MFTSKRQSLSFASFFSFYAITASAAAQCPPQWIGGEFTPGLNGSVQAVIRWDPDGIGPQAPVSVAGGFFSSGVARWNGSTWVTFGAGLQAVKALAVLPNGDLVAGGQFEFGGDGATLHYIARWNGPTWVPYGSGPFGTGMGGGSFPYVYALAVQPNGDLLAGGEFFQAGTVNASRIARWNGSAWFALGPPQAQGVNAAVVALAVLSNGDVIAGGQFSAAGNSPASHIARWNGSTWATLAGGMEGDPFPQIYSLAVMPNGDLVAGGFFNNAGGVSASNVARWNGSTWAALGGGVDGDVYALAAFPNGDLVAGGNFTTAGGVSANYVARWNGSTWTPLGTGVSVGEFSAVNALMVLPDGDVLAGGSFATAGGVTAHNVARYTFGTPPPSIAAQPQNAVACNSATATFAVTAAGAGTFTYQWRKDVAAIDTIANPSAATATLTLNNVQPADAASYDCVVTNACGSVISEAATLTLEVCCAPDIDNSVNVDDLLAVIVNWAHARRHAHLALQMSLPHQSATVQSMWMTF